MYLEFVPFFSDSISFPCLQKKSLKMLPVFCIPFLKLNFLLSYSPTDVVSVFPISLNRNKNTAFSPFLQVTSEGTSISLILL